jgi:hypothetical protein
MRFVPRLGPWFQVYGQLDKTGMMLTASIYEVAVSGGLRGHPGVVVGFRWRTPTRWTKGRTWSTSFRSKATP